MLLKFIFRFILPFLSINVSLTCVLAHETQNDNSVIEITPIEKNLELLSSKTGAFVRNKRALHILFPPEEGEGNWKSTPESVNRDPPTTTRYPSTMSTTRKPKGLDMTSSTANHGGTCHLRCGCSHRYIPFCASNGITYANRCQLQCAKQHCDKRIRIKFEGVCAVPHKHHRHNNWINFH